ncbi:MAG: hypothetical protein VYD19_02545, partial [Myxococcota bacterium]|nr:hypothetical protein [Myxococcota bacterium]
MRELIEKNSGQVLDAAPALLQALFSLPDPPPLPFAKSCLTVGLEALTAPSEARTLYAHLIEMQRPLSPQSAVRFFQLLEGQLITLSEVTGSSFASVLDWLEWRSSCGDALLALLDYIEEARREASRLTELQPLSPPLQALLHRRGMISPSVRESLLNRLGPFYKRGSDQQRCLLLLLRESEAAPWPWVLPTVAATLSEQHALVKISLCGQRHLPQATLRSLARHLLALPAGRAPDEKTLRHRLEWITSRCPEGRAQLYAGWPLLLWWLGEGERPSQVMYMGVAGRQRLLFDALFVLVRAAARDAKNRLLFIVEETQWMSELEWAFFHQLRLSLGEDVSCACLFSVPESGQVSVPEWLSLQSEVEWWDWEARDTEPPLIRLLGAPADPALDPLSESAPHEGALFELLCTLALEGWIELIDGQWSLQRPLPPEPFKAIELLWGAALRGLPEGALVCLERLRELEGMLLDRASIERFVDSGGLGQMRRLEEAGWCRWVEAPGGGAFQFISGSLQRELHKLSSRRQRRAE